MTKISANLILCTNPGRGGVSVIRLTGKEPELAKIDSLINAARAPLAEGGLVYGWLRNSTGEVIDEVLLSAPEREIRLLTGHGGTANTLAIIETLKFLGLRELSAELNLENNQSVESFLYHSHTEAQAALVLAEFKTKAPNLKRIFKALTPKYITIIGAPNCGKSSLLNYLCDEKRALISEEAGTTLDHVEHFSDIGGHYCCICDTAGFRHMAGDTEQQAIKRAENRIINSDLLLHIFDGSRNLCQDDLLASKYCHEKNVLVVINKADQPQISDILTQITQASNYSFDIDNVTEISCHNGKGLELLNTRIINALGGDLLP